MTDSKATLLVNLCSGSANAAKGKQRGLVLTANLELTLTKKNDAWTLDDLVIPAPATGEHTVLYMIVSGVAVLSLFTLAICLHSKKNRYNV